MFRALLGCLLWPAAVSAQTNASQSAATTNAMLVDIRGSVEVSSAGRDVWSAGRRNQHLFPGDKVRTGERSRAVIDLGKGTVIEKDELSVFEIPPSPNSNFKKGLFRIFEREKAPRSQYNLPSGTAAIRGTDFLVRVDENGRTELTVMDGDVVLTNPQGEVHLTNGLRGILDGAAPPRATPVLESVNDLIQWSLYYPGVVDLDAMGFAAEEQRTLSDTFAAYRNGDLLQALASYPKARQPSSDAERCYLAQLLLAVGRVDDAQALISGPPSSIPWGRALRTVIASVKFQPVEPREVPASASEWVAESYYQQSQARLEEALKAARRATDQSPRFGFAWARVAELEFSFGRTANASAALDQALQLSPRNAQAVALRGFLLAAQNRIASALDAFEQAILLDGALGNAWLGRGLCRIRQGETASGQRDLLMAAALEPQRAVFHSYLGKAFSNAGEDVQARHELDLARAIDPNDPTSWLYSALHKQQRNRINEAVRDLEQSQSLSDNRGRYRSQLLLDQDRAVRSANLANIYHDAGMTEVSVREAVRAVNSDYGNYSAHLFLANSYDRLRDPNQINLRYETPFFSEYLMANLLAPVGAGTLSQNISQQEYSKLFEQDRFGFSSTTEYLSRGDWAQGAAQYGSYRNVSYSVEVGYRSENGERPNNDLEQKVFIQQFKVQVSPRDTVYFQAFETYTDSGNLIPYYDPASATNAPVRVQEDQEPILIAGYHHEWSPGMHTLLLASRLDDTLSVQNPIQHPLVIATNGLFTTDPVNGVDDVNSVGVWDQQYRSRLDIYSTELQQILELPRRNTVVAGARFQIGEFKTENDQTLISDDLVAAASPPVTPAPAQKISSDFQRFNAYGYEHWRPHDSLELVGGVSYDHLEFPANHRYAPVSDEEETEEMVSPKAGLIWSPVASTVVRAAYTRSLGGVSFDQSFQLEPTQVAGFNQAFRSIMPEAVVGANSGAEFETYGVSLEYKWRKNTYFGLSGEILNSDVDRQIGALMLDLNPVPGPSVLYNASTPERLDFRERTVAFSVNQLLGDEWSVGARYRLSEANLKDTFQQIPTSFIPPTDVSALLHQLDLFTIFNHRCGFFSRFDALWYSQRNHGYAPGLPGDDFWQLHLAAGYRLPRRQAELTLALLNIFDQDYRLNPLNLYNEPPRERTLAVQLRLNF